MLFMTPAFHSDLDESKRESKKFSFRLCHPVNTYTYTHVRVRVRTTDRSCWVDAQLANGGGLGFW